MKQETIIRVRLCSAATFGSGAGKPGLVDEEIELDEQGFPYLRGRNLKGLLVEEAEGIVFALTRQNKAQNWETVKNRLFGVPGSGLDGRGILHIGDARLPQALQTLLEAELYAKEPGFTADELLEAITGVRRQTALNEWGGPEESTLRSERVLMRGLTLEAPVRFESEPEAEDWTLLAACVLALRRAGSGRNRGRGRLEAELGSLDETRGYFEQFQAAILGHEVPS